MSTAARITGTAPPATAAAASVAPILLIGNPNVGKSVLFSALTGRYATVSNYPGTTVTLTRGRLEIEGHKYDVLDTPGINSLAPHSEDEIVTRDVLLAAPPHAIVQVADAKNLRRALMISTQLAELGLPFTIAANMSDEAHSLGMRVDPVALERRLGVRVVETIATRGQGIDELRHALTAQQASTFRVAYPPAIEAALLEMQPFLPECHLAKRGLGTALLLADAALRTWVEARTDATHVARLEALATRARAAFQEPLAVVLNRCRFAAVDAVLQEVENRPERRRVSTWLERFGRLSMHPVWGIPILLVVLAGMYQFVGVFGAGTLVEGLETKLFGAHVAPWSMRATDAMLRFPHQHVVIDGIATPEYTTTALSTAQDIARLVHDFLVGPYGQVTMALSYALALILPIVTTFFIAFGLLEDSGYMPRLAVMVNRVFRSMGLNGKAVLPMVLGLGCDTMATLTTRILETRKERVLVTLLLALAVPCSAQLGVILGMMRSLSPAATMVWCGTMLGTLFFVGWAAAKLIPGERADFVLELAPIRRPQLRNVAIKTLARVEWYLREAVPLFLIGTALLFALDRLHLLGAIERLSAPVVRGVLGLPEQAAQAFLIGFLRRDYGAAGLYDMSRQGQLDDVQLVVSMVTITLFIPCVANFLIMIKERGMRTAVGMAAFIVPFALGVGGALNYGLRALGVTF